ncbi:MAG: hypothetical protein CMH55_06525 [Myxococcales bacterium]|nr:hypothetical protein [Myxococcales bacterium]|tara:strand:+ start:392 stop:1120 length:729 start_codon:yes stop_codon:yes gene_type:complete
MILLFSLMLANPVDGPTRTQIQVEALGQPDHRGELQAELARVRSELAELQAVVAAMPDGPTKDQELARLQEFESLTQRLNQRIAELPTASSPPEASKPPIKVTPIEIVPKDGSPARPPLLFLGLGLLLGVLLAALAWPRMLDPSQAPHAPPGPGRLVVTAGILGALGLSLPSLGYAQDPILFLWMALSAGLLIRLSGLSLGSQMQRFLLDRSRPLKRSHEQSRPTGSSDHPGSGEAPAGDEA